MFKCLTPPNFDLLNRIILHDYKSLRIPNPRFIFLKHRTLSNELVKAQIVPSKESSIEINVSFSVTLPHSNAGRLPRLKPSQITIKKCRDSRCATCPHLNCKKFFTSSKTGKSYPIRHSFSCSSRYVVYLITCSKCKKQYTGQSTQKLKTRMNHHRSNIFCKVKTYIARHFNFPDHSIKDLKVQCIDTTDSFPELLHLESYWRTTLKTLHPHGLNVLP